MQIQNPNPIGMTSYILYKVDDDDDHCWEERRLLPYGGLTDILAQEIDYGSRDERIPKIGERMRQYANLEDPGNGITHGSDSDWVVADVDVFESSKSGDRVIICYCKYEPITPEWKEIPEGAPVHELMTT